MLTSADKLILSLMMEQHLGSGGHWTLSEGRECVLGPGRHVLVLVLGEGKGRASLHINYNCFIKMFKCVFR